MKDHASKAGTGVNFVPPLLFPDTSPRWEMGEILDETAKKEIRIIRGALERARKNPTLIVGYTLPDE